VQAARQQWKQDQAKLDPAKLVFLDETWTSTNMTALRGRSPRGTRCIGAAPHGHWLTSTFIAALRVDSITAPMVADGPMDGQLFLEWVRQFLCPTLRPGDIVIADNLSSHKVAGVSLAIEATGAKLMYLPPYSPDMNPIEQVFSKLKTLLRKAGLRTLEALTTKIAELLDTITPRECRNYLAAAGYVID
jgi:transposase